MKKDVSIILPSIRPHYLETFYASVERACKKYTFEIIIPTPFDVPEDIKRRGNVKVIKTHATATVAKQMAIQLCNGEFLYNVTDDGFILEDAIDKAIDMHRSTLGPKDIVNMIYVEGINVLDQKTLKPLTDTIRPWPDTYWEARWWESMQIPGIEEGWKICLHFFMTLDYFKELGGLDCRWEYSNHAILDLNFRVQADGGKIVNLPTIASAFTHFPGSSGDHGPIREAQEGPDTQLFLSIYTIANAAKERIKINYDNWREQPDVWTRRFNKDYLPITRDEYEKLNNI